MQMRIRIMPVTLSILIFLASNVLQGGVNKWTSIGPGGGDVETIAIDPVNPSILYVGTMEGLLFKSLDGGESWVMINNGLKDTLPFLSLTIDPVVTSTLYTVQGWTSTPGGIEYAVSKSMDGGATWYDIKGGFPDNIWINGTVIDPINTNRLYAYSDGGDISPGDGVFLSMDGGLNWSAVNNGLTNTNIQDLAIDPQNPFILYAGTYEGGVFKTTDGGQNWSPANNGLPNGSVAFSLAVDPDSTDILYVGLYVGSAGNEKGVYKSINGGANWTQLTDAWAGRITIDPADTDILYGATWTDGVYRSTDGGVTWQTMNTGLTTPSIRCMAIDPLFTNILYTGTDGGGVFKSTDNGYKWNLSNAGLNCSNIWAFAVDPVREGTLYASPHHGGLQRSRDGGDHWKLIDIGIPAFTDFLTIAINPDQTEILYTGTMEEGVFKSQNSGESWYPINNGLPPGSPVNVLLIDASTTNVLYGGTDHGVYKSTDGGSSWTLHNNGLPPNKAVFTIVIHPLYTNVLYVHIPDEAVFKSVDGGQNWFPATSGLPYYDLPFDLAIDPIDKNIVYAGTTGGVYRTNNGGDDWCSINTGLPIWPMIMCVAVDVFDRNVLYAGDVSEGAFMSLNAGLSWFSINNGLSAIPQGNIPEFGNLIADPFHPMLVYAGTKERGILGFQYTGAFPASDSDDNCFIATAAYGSYLDPHVRTLRNFRDEFLLPHAAGRAFVRFYYKCSPPIASFIKRHETLRTVTRWVLMLMVWFIEKPAVGIFIIIAVISLIILYWKRRTGRRRSGGRARVTPNRPCEVVRSHFVKQGNEITRS